MDYLHPNCHTMAQTGLQYYRTLELKALAHHAGCIVTS